MTNIVCTQIGISVVTAAVQRSGGTVAHPGKVLDDTLEDLAASIELDACLSIW